MSVKREAARAKATTPLLKRIALNPAIRRRHQKNKIEFFKSDVRVMEDAKKNACIDGRPQPPALSGPRYCDPDDQAVSYRAISATMLSLRCQVSWRSRSDYTPSSDIRLKYDPAQGV